MMNIVLQFGSSGPVQLAILVSELVTTILGLAIGYFALQGYRRNGSRPMLFVAIGFVLAFWTPIFLVVGPILLPSADFAFGVVGQVGQMIGLVSILYGLRMPLR